MPAACSCGWLTPSAAKLAADIPIAGIIVVLELSFSCPVCGKRYNLTANTVSDFSKKR